LIYLKLSRSSWITETLPRVIGAWIAAEFGIEYQSRSGLIALLHRLGMEHRKPKVISCKLDPQKQAAFIRAYENLLNQLDADEAVIFADAVHPTHAVRPVGCWAPKDVPDWRIKLHFIPAYCPHLNPIERLWGLMHRHTTHNKCYANFRDFSIAMLNFLRHDVPGNWGNWRDEATDNFRVINPIKYRILT
jgi:transposase